MGTKIEKRKREGEKERGIQKKIGRERERAGERTKVK